MPRNPGDKPPKTISWRGLPQGRARARSDADGQRVTFLAQQRIMRAGWVLALVTALFLVQGYRLFYWQVLQRDAVLERVESTPLFQDPEIERRGTIRDRNGYLLATDEVTYRFSISPNIVSYPERTATQVAEISGLDREELLAIMLRDSTYELVSTSLSATVGQELELLEERAFKLEPVMTRRYPSGDMAAHLLGFVNAERDGLAGIEMYYDGLLRGSEVITATGTAAAEISLGARPFSPSEDGVDLILTLDRTVQVMAEQELAAAIAETGAEGGTVIVMEPQSGDILAMASQPSYDPNRYADYIDDMSIFLNPAISEIYEPGSVFKIITVAAALDLGLVTPETPWTDPGHFEVGGRVITNWNQQAYGTRTITEILGLSLNTGTAWLNTLIGAERFYQYVDAFGFGRATGVDAASEVAGQVKHPGDGLWHPSDLGTNAFGQGIAVTPLQMITSVASLLNDGQLMQPRLVRATIADGVLSELPPVVRGQSVSPATAATMRELMADAVEVETVSALPEGWRVGGKTGTAQIAIPGGYHATDTIASFIGYGPVAEPAFVILVRLDRPQGDFQWGSTSAAPVFKRLMTRLLEYYNIPPDAMREARSP